MPRLTVMLLVLIGHHSAMSMRKHLIVDMTHPFTQSSVYWPGLPTFNFTVLHRDYTPEGFWLEVNSFGAGEHGGTHIDVPSHMIQDGKRLHEIPLDRMIGTGAWIDMSNTARYDRDLLMTIDDIVRWEDTNGRLPDHGILIVSFDWSYRYRDRTNYLGSIDPDDASTFHFPGIALETARWLISNRKLTAIGIDTPSLDGGQGIDFMVHRTFLEYGILGLENLNLQKIRSLPPRGFTVFAIPMLIQDGSGAPLRAFAVQNTYYNRYSSLQYCP